MNNIRVSPSFSSNSIKQAYVADLLLILSRKKAEFITEAILFFIANNDISAIPASKNSREDLILKIDQAKFLLGEDWDTNYKIQQNRGSNESAHQNQYAALQKADTVNNDTDKNPINDNKQEKKVDNVDDFLDAISAFY